jgi:6-phosphogluconolactonase (cycloisomerase 2 family)
MPGNNVAVFRIDGSSGRLTLIGSPVEVTSPACIRILTKW